VDASTPAGAVLGFLPLLCASAPQPSDWVPMRWPWSDPASLELLSGTPIKLPPAEDGCPHFVQAAAARGVVTLAVILRRCVAAAARRAIAAAKVAARDRRRLPEGARRPGEGGCRRRARSSS